MTAVTAPPQVTPFFTPLRKSGASLSRRAVANAPRPRRTPREEGIERIHIDGKAHGQPFHNDADGLAVRSAEDRDAKVFSQTAHGVSSLFKALKSSPKHG